MKSALLSVLAAPVILAVAACSSETTESLPPVADAGFVCGGYSNSWPVVGGVRKGSLDLSQCPNGKVYAFACDGAQCTCKTDGTVTATVAQSTITFGPTGNPSLTEIYKVCSWP